MTPHGSSPIAAAPSSTTPVEAGAVDHVERLEAVHELMTAVGRADELADIFRAAIAGLLRAVGAHRAAVLLQDEDGVMRFKAWHGLSDAYRAAVEGHSPWRRDEARPQPVLVSDVLLDPTLAPYGDRIVGEGIHAMGFIPLVTPHGLIGKFMVYYDEPHAFDEQEVRLAQVIAGHVAFAVERKRVEDNLALYRTIFAHSSDAIAIIDTQGRYLEQNAAHRALIGFTDEELVDHTPAIHLGDERFEEIVRVLRSEGVYQNDVASTTRSGHRRQFDLSAFTVRDAAGEPVCYVAIERDITERKRVEQALQFLARASATLDRSLIFDATLEALAHLTVPYLADWAWVDIVSRESGVRHATSVHSDPGRKADLADLFDQRETAGSAHLTSQAIETGGARRLPEARVTLETEFGGGARAAAVLGRLGARSSITVPLKARGRILGALTMVAAGRAYGRSDAALAEDLARRAATALDNARLYREAQESDRRKEQFLAVLAHELRNPLAPMMTSLEVLKIDPNGANLTRAREVMERQLHNLVRLVDDLLDLSRITHGKIQLEKRTIVLGDLVARAIETARPLLASRGLELALDVADDVTFEGDPLRLEQVLANLLNNAAKYTASGGHVHVSAAREGDWISLRVRDDGIGIARDMLLRVFEMFEQGGRSADGAPGGLGIGLTLVRNLVGMHGGTVCAISDGVGRGSEFVVRVPAGAPVAWSADRDVAEPEPQAPPIPLRILVVDDNLDAAQELGRVLGARGHDVRLAHDGASAVELAASFVPDLALLDIGLPDLGGYDVAERIRARHPATRLVAVSGYFGQSQHRQRSQSAGFMAQLVKPVDLARLDALLERCREPRRRV